MAQTQERKPTKLSSDSKELGIQLVNDIVKGLEKMPEIEKNQAIIALLDLMQKFYLTDKQYAEFILDELQTSLDNQKLKSFKFPT